MKAILARVLGALEGAAAAAFTSGILIGIFGWRLDSTPKIVAFLGVVLIGAISGSIVGARVAQRRATHLATQARQA